MKLLLDTNVFLFWNSDSPKLSAKARQAIGNAKNDLFLSAASSWEIAIKHALGKLTLPQNPEAYVTERLREHAIEPIAIEHAETFRAANLPPLHEDPFDRLLIAQALHRRMRVVTKDARFAEYGVDVIW